MWEPVRHIFQLIYSHSYQLWAAVGPLVGVAFGAWLAAHWQRQKWILDNKTAEYRSLFDALSAYRIVLTEYYALYEFANAVVTAQKRYDDDLALARAYGAVTDAFADRIFTRQAIAKSGARKEWNSYAQKMLPKQKPDMSERNRILDSVHDKLVQASQDDLDVHGE